MKNRLSVSACAVAFILAGCGGSQPPIGAPGAMPQAPVGGAHFEPDGSWMLPEAKTDDLLYLVDREAREVDVYSYPQRQRVGTLTAPRGPAADCVDRAGNIWILGAEIVEYAHGGAKLIKKLSPPIGSFDPTGCAVDPSSGDLAVTAVEAPLFVYPKASGPPKQYGANWTFDQDCAFADRGNLYVVGTVGETSSEFRAAVWNLTKRRNSLQRIRFHDSIRFFYSSGVQWDGRHIAWGDFNQRYIYRIGKPKGSWSVIGTTILQLRANMGEFWIHGNVVIVPYTFATSSGGGAVGFYRYPRGGARFATIGGFQAPVAVTYSPASAHEKAPNLEVSRSVRPSGGAQ